MVSSLYSVPYISDHEQKREGRRGGRRGERGRGGEGGREGRKGGAEGGGKERGRRRGRGDMFLRTSVLATIGDIHIALHPRFLI